MHDDSLKYIQRQNIFIFLISTLNAYMSIVRMFLQLDAGFKEMLRKDYSS